MIKIEGAYGIASDCKVRRCCNRYIAIDLEIRAEDANSLKEIMVKVIKCTREVGYQRWGHRFATHRPEGVGRSARGERRQSHILNASYGRGDTLWRGFTATAQRALDAGPL
jgi:hypothetical protein